MQDFAPETMTHSGLKRFADAVDVVMNADDITNRERVHLIAFWAYQYQRPDMLDQLAKAIERCQADPATLMVNASSKIDTISGEIVAYHNGELESYTTRK